MSEPLPGNQQPLPPPPPAFTPPPAFPTSAYPPPASPPPAFPPPAFPPPPQPSAPPARKPPKGNDRLAAAVANASLLSIGYMMLGRRGLAVLSLVITYILIFGVMKPVHSLWPEIVLVLWWLAMIAHGWFLARGPAEPRRRIGQRVLAVCVALPALLLAGLLRYDGARIGHDVTEAKASGDCPQAVAAIGRAGTFIRLANGPLITRQEVTIAACRQLDKADGQLTTALTGNTDALAAGFDTLGTVLKDEPGHEKMVDTVLDKFLTGLPVKVQKPCDTVDLTDWLGQRAKNGTTLDRSAAVVPQTAPAALVGCADSLMSGSKPDDAKARYQQLIAQYPNDTLKAKATAGITKADAAINLAAVRASLSGPTSEQPAYCSSPVKYPPAKPYGKGTNKALFYGNDTEVGRLPDSWQVGDVTKAQLVVCIGDDKQGSVVRTCSYQSYTSGRHDKVSFHKIKFTVKAYEVRTGKLVVNKTLQFSGSSCPSVISYTTSEYGVDLGPDKNQDVKVSAADVKAAFSKIIVR